MNLKTGFNQWPSLSISRWLAGGGIYAPMTLRPSWIGSMDVLTIHYHVTVTGIYPPYPGMGDDAFRLYVILAAVREMTAE